MAKLDKYYNFYEECLKSGFTDFDDPYLNQKICLLAKKYELDNYMHFSADDFEKAIDIHDEYIKKQNETEEKENNKAKQALIREIQKEEDEILENVRRYSNKKGRDKIVAMCNTVISYNQAEVESIEREERREYRSKRSIVIPSALVGGTIEGLTGSTLAGVYNAVNHEAVNDAKRARNAEIARDVFGKHSGQKNDLKSIIDDARSILNNLDSAYIGTDLLLARNLVVDNLEMFISETGALRIRAYLGMSKIQDLPNNINAYIDGTMKALIYNKSTKEVADEILMTLGFQGLKNRSYIEGVSTSSPVNKDNLDQYACEIVDYNLFAVEYSKQLYASSIQRSFNTSPSVEYYYEKAKPFFEKGGVENYKTALRYASYVDSYEPAEKITKETSNWLKDHYYKQCTSAIDSLDPDLIRDSIANLKYIDENQKDDIESRLKDQLLKAKGAQKEEKRKLEEENKQKAEKQAKKAKKTVVFVSIIAAILAIMLFIYVSIISPNLRYKNAIKLFEAGDFEKAAELFDGLGNYEDAGEKANEAKYNAALNYISANDYDNSVRLLEQLNGYKDVDELLKDLEYENIIGTNLNDYEELLSELDAFEDKYSDHSYKDALYYKGLAYFKLKGFGFFAKNLFEEYLEKGTDSKFREEAKGYLLEIRKEEVNEAIKSFRFTGFNEGDVKVLRENLDLLNRLSDDELVKEFSGYQFYQKGAERYLNFYNNGRYSITKGYSWSKEELHNWYISDDMLYTANWYKNTDKATKNIVWKLAEGKYLWHYDYRGENEATAYFELLERKGKID